MKKNILLKSRNILPHLTGSVKNILLGLLIILFGLVVFGGAKVSALGYQNSVGLEFTFEPVLAISLSSADLLIPNLAPGSSAYSNTITVNVDTTNIAGYTLSAKVGNGTTYTDDKLTNASSGTYFTNLASGTTLANFQDNEWGYALGTISNETTYAGLVYDEDTVINATTNATGTAASSGCVSTCSGTNATDFTIAAKASATQAYGDYKNVIIFTVVGNEPPQYLYDKVEELSRGTLAENDILLTDAITTPTSTNKDEDTSNSGVFIYDPVVYGVASDATNAYAIYFYRGILETNPGSVGSLGSANAYPNYVKLSNNTCWRIVRTTGSGGIKMIYNGIWTGSTCANSNASIGAVAFASQGTSTQSDWIRNATYVGYTYNNNVTDSTASTPLSIIFGSDAHPELNNTRSNIKTYVEDTWYASNMVSYTGMLEASAGYCADRSSYSDDSSSSLQDQSTTIGVPFSSSDMYRFGSRIRGESATPSLTCPRKVVDLYRYTANSLGVGNELKYPAALVTSDEVILSGGSVYDNSAYNSLSFMTSNYAFWTMSPQFKYNELTYVFPVYNDGRMYGVRIDDNYAVRPVISLVSNTIVTGGTGVATDPWTIK